MFYTSVESLDLLITIFPVINLTINLNPKLEIFELKATIVKHVN